MGQTAENHLDRDTPQFVDVAAENLRPGGVKLGDGSLQVRREQALAHALDDVFVFGLQEVGVVVVNVGSVTSRQHLIPRNLYGRVGSVHRLAVTCAGVAGALVAGLVASASSVPVTMLSAGLLMVFVLVAFGPALLRRLPVASAK